MTLRFNNALFKKMKIKYIVHVYFELLPFKWLVLRIKHNINYPFQTIREKTTVKVISHVVGENHHRF